MKSILLFFTCCLFAQALFAQDTTAHTKLTFLEKMRALKEGRSTTGPSAESTLPIDESTHKVSFKEMVEAGKASKHALFERAKKWLSGKGSKANPYAITLEDEEQGSIVAKGTFTVPAKRKRFVVQFVIGVSTKEGKYRYSFTDLTIALETQAGGKGFGYGPFSSHSSKKAETLEYSIETFYPSRLTSHLPVIKYFEDIDEDSFAAIRKELQSLAASLKANMSGSEADW